MGLSRFLAHGGVYDERHEIFSIPSQLQFSLAEPAILSMLKSNQTRLGEFKNIGIKYNISPPTMALLLETIIISNRGTKEIMPIEVWKEASRKLSDVMYPSITQEERVVDGIQFLEGNWGTKLKKHTSILGSAGEAFASAICVQENNARMGLVSAAPTCGSSGIVPAVLYVISTEKELSWITQVEALLVAGLIGFVAFMKGPVSGSQAGCGGEIGVAAAMAAGAAAYLSDGGDWGKIDSAAALAMTPFIGLECSPSFGLVEYPCIPRNGFAALCVIAAAEAVSAGIKVPYDTDQTFERLFKIGSLLPECAKERESGHWMETLVKECGLSCVSCRCGRK